MSDLKDFRFDSKSAPEDFQTGPVPPTSPPGGNDDGRKLGLRIALIAVCIVLVAAIAYVLLRRPADPAPEVAAPAASEAPAAAPGEPEVEPEPPLELPELAASDQMVADLVGALSARPRLAAWLATDDLVRRFAAAIVNIAEGATPKTHLGVLAPDEPFTVSQQGGAPRPTERSYARYDAVAEVIASLDVEGTVKLYGQLEPLLDEAFLELGYPGQDFHQMLVNALDHLLATPAIEGDVALEPTVAAYKFADPELEALSAAQKQLLRMGPDNVRRVQTKLRSLRRALLTGEGS